MDSIIATGADSGDGESVAEPNAGVDGLQVLPTAAEEVAPARAIERGDKAAKRRMTESNLRLVAAIAQGYGGLGVPCLDLIQEGTLGPGDPVAGDKAVDLCDEAVESLRRQAVRHALGRLPAREQRILELRFGYAIENDVRQELDVAPRQLARLAARTGRS